MPMMLTLSYEIGIMDKHSLLQKRKEIEMALKKTVQRIAINYYKTKFKLLATVSKKKAAEKAFQLFCTPQSRKNKKQTPVFESAEKMHFSVEGITVRGWRFNHMRRSDRQTHSSEGHSKGNPIQKRVLILHGWESSVTNFDKYINKFIKKGYEVLAFDAPAHGSSDGKMISAPLYAKMIKEIHKTFGPVKSYMAHSFGGLSVSLALEEINHTDDYKLALIAPATETTTSLSIFYKFLELDTAVQSEIEKLIIKKGGKSTDWYSIPRAMKNIKAKVLWVHDEDDIVTPISDLMKLKNEKPSNIEFVITKGLGHSRIYRDTTVINSVVDFF